MFFCNITNSKFNTQNHGFLLVNATITPFTTLANLYYKPKLYKVNLFNIRDRLVGYSPDLSKKAKTKYEMSICLAIRKSSSFYHNHRLIQGK